MEKEYKITVTVRTYTDRLSDIRNDVVKALLESSEIRAVTDIDIERTVSRG